VPPFPASFYIFEQIKELSLTKELKIYDGEIAASSTKTAGKTG
jgi:hypothetical protein